MTINHTMKKLIAEFIGTFLLTYGVMLSLGSSIAPITPVVAAFILAFVAYAIGSITGAHINPAITLSIWSVGKIEGRLAGKYVLSQVLGGLLAMLATHAYSNIQYASMFPITSKMQWVACGAELIGAAIFAFGIASIVHGNVSKSASGAMAGMSLLLGLFFAASLGSLAILNPAVALGLGVWNAMYIIGPIVGAMIGAKLYKMLNQAPQ